jgi:superfamily II DNA/RNA helicase
MLQEDRLEAFDQFKRNSFRFMVATDVIGRGMDVEHLNVVFNYGTSYVM